MMMYSFTVLQLRCLEKDKCGRFVLHCLQLRPKMAYRTLESYKLVNITSQSEVARGFPVRVSISLVISCALDWSYF